MHDGQRDEAPRLLGLQFYDVAEFGDGLRGHRAFARVVLVHSLGRRSKAPRERCAAPAHFGGFVNQGKQGAHVILAG